MKICLLWNQFLICYRNVTFCTNLFLIYVSFSLYFMSSFETGLLFQSLGHFVNIGISFSMCSDWKVFSGSYKKISAPTKKYHCWAISLNEPIFNNNNKGILVCIHYATCYTSTHVSINIAINGDQSVLVYTYSYY